MDKLPSTSTNEQKRDTEIRELLAKKKNAEIAERKVLSRATREVLLSMAEDVSLFDTFVEENLQKAKREGRVEIPADMATMYDLTPAQQIEIAKQTLKAAGLETSTNEEDEDTVQEIVSQSEKLARSYLQGEFGAESTAETVETPEIPIPQEKAENKLENIGVWSQISFEGTIYVVTQIKNGLDGREYVLVPPEPKEIETVAEAKLKEELKNGNAVLVSETEATDELIPEGEKWTIKDAAEERWLRAMLVDLEEAENKEAVVEPQKMTEFFEKSNEETNEERRVIKEKREQLMQKLEPIEKEQRKIELEMKLDELTLKVASTSANLDSLIKQLEKKKKNFAVVKKFFDPKMSELTHKIAKMNIELEQWEKQLKVQKERAEIKMKSVLGQEKLREREEIKEALRTLEKQDNELEAKQRKVIDALNPAKQDSSKSES